MKKLLFFLALVLSSSNLIAATYYVDCNANGDAGAGTSTDLAVAWKTINKVNTSSFSPGDSVLFAKGCAWREQLIPPSSGSAGAPITFGAYGTGSAPIITGAVVVAAGAWSDYGGNLWATADAVTPNFVYFDGTLGTRVYVAPAAPLEWGWDANVLYVYSAGNPATTYTNPGVEVGYFSAPVYVNSKDYITFDGLRVQRDNAWANLVINGTSDHIVVQNCVLTLAFGSGVQINENTQGNVTLMDNTVSDNWASGINAYKSSASAGNEFIVSGNTVSGNGLDGINVYATYTIVEHNEVYSNGVRTDQAVEGIHVFDDQDGTGTWGNNNTVRYNLCYDNHGATTDAAGILLDHYCDNNLVSYNVCHTNQGAGIVNFKASGNNYYNNTCVGNGQNPSSVMRGEIVLWDDAVTDRSQNVNVKNNLGWATADTTYAVMIEAHVTNNTGISITNNLWGNANTENWYWDGGAGGANIGTWNAFAWVGTDQYDDPLFLGLVSADLRLQPGSPAINAGVNVSLTTDFYNLPISGNPDIGAIEAEANGYAQRYPVVRLTSTTTGNITIYDGRH